MARDEEQPRRTAVLGPERPPPPPDWRKRDFDDRAWASARGGDVVGPTDRYGADAVFARGTDEFVPEVGLVAARGKFRIEDRSKVRKLALTLTCRGGFVACLNGVEVARGAMPAGEVRFDTASVHEYPPEAFLARAPGGKLGGPLHHYTHRHKQFHPQWALREKSFGPFAIDPARLRDGVNVLAVESHRADYPALCAKRKVGLCFATVGLCRLALTAETPADNVATTAERPPGFQVWNVPPFAGVRDTDYGNRFEPLRAVRIPAARNGTFAGQLALGSRHAIEGLSAHAGEFTGPGKIPAANVRILFGRPNPLHPGRYYDRGNGIGGTRGDLLTHVAPATVAPLTPAIFKTGWFIRPRVAQFRRELGLAGEPVLGATLPVWVSVTVPADAPAGEYAATLTLRAKGIPAVKVPVELAVADWTLPDVADYASLIFIYQSPDSLAEYYRLTPWSQRHWAMIERSLELAGDAGSIGLNVPLLAKTQPGNVESMVVWLRKPDGSYAFDFRRLDRYLDTALKYHSPDRLKVVALYVWGRELGCPRDKRTAEGPDYREKAYRGALVTVLETATGRHKDMRLPDFERPQAEALLRPLLLAVRDRLKARRLEGAMMLAVGSDPGILPEHAAALRRILPGVPWLRDSHFAVGGTPYDRKDRRKLVPVACNTIVWSGHVPDPKAKRRYGWRVTPGRYTLSFNRAGVSSLNLRGFPDPWRYLIWMECSLALGRNGAGRVGGDYFSANPKRWVDNRYPGAAIGGALKIYNGCPDLFGPQPDGPVPTVRYENTRMGVQAAEARVFIEKAIVARSIPEDLARRCQSLLDQRTNAIRMAPLGRSLGRQGWAASTRELFELAAEVSKACAEKH